MAAGGDGDTTTGVGRCALSWKLKLATQRVNPIPELLRDTIPDGRATHRTGRRLCPNYNCNWSRVASSKVSESVYEPSPFYEDRDLCSVQMNMKGGTPPTPFSLISPSVGESVDMESDVGSS